MPKIIKKKVVQKKAVQEDEVKGFALDALDVVKERQKILIIAGSVIAAVLALFITFSMYSSSLKADAVAIEMKANNYYFGEFKEGVISDEERLKKALDFYKESVAIKMTPTALYNLGNTYYRMGDYANAIKQYDTFTDEFGGNKELIPLVFQKLAASYVRVGQNDKAFGALKKLAKVKGGLFKDTALVLEARYLEFAGDNGKSLDKYLKLVTEFPSSPWSGEAASKLPKPEVETEEKAAEAEKKEE